MGRAGLRQVSVGCAKAVQHTGRFNFNLRRIGKQHIGVKVALQRHAIAHPRPCLGQINGPVQAQHLAVKLAHGF